MTTLSKFFKQHIEQKYCQDILHAGSCREHLIKDLFLFTLSNFKHFAPVCLLPAVIKFNSLNKKKLRKTLEYYLGCALMGTSHGYSINLLICLLRYLRGKFGYYSLIFIPTFLGCLPLYLGPDRVINLFETTVFQCNIETFFLMRKNIISRTIADSKILQTCLFMVCSAVILHVKQMYNLQGFWLLKPNPKKFIDDNDEKCSDCDLHPQNTCKQYVINGMRSYFILGLSLDLIKMALSHVPPSPSQSKFVAKLKNFKIRSVALLTAYVGIYRFVHCWLNRKGYCSDVINHITSSFLAGSCYFLYPQQTLFSFALVQGIRSAWKIFEVSNMDAENKALKLIRSIPFARIAYPFGLANLTHLNVLQPKYISPLTATVTSGIANKYPVKIQKRINLLKAQS